MMKCPNCGKTWIAKIFYGLPADMAIFEKELDAKKIALGGCVLYGDDPKWECNDCGHQWGKVK